MAIRTWLNGHQAAFNAATDWSGGKAPVAGDTAVIGSSGDGPPQSRLGAYLYSLGTADSGAALFTGPLIDSEYPYVLVQEPDGTLFEYRPPAPVGSQVPAGLTLASVTVDLLGEGSLAALGLQNSTIASSATVNVVGTALLGAFYDNTLAGTIRVGEPTRLSGQPVTPPAGNSHGYSNELDISVSGDGSWGAGGTLDGYVPATTNTGSILVGAGADLRINIQGSTGGAFTSGGIDYLVPPIRSAFVNDGAIVVSAGGAFGTDGADQTVGATTASGAYSSFVNNGTVTVDGAAGLQTLADFQAAEVSGSGAIAINGGTQTDPSQTAADVTGILDSNVSIHDGTLLLAVDNKFYDNGSGPQFLGGGIAMRGAATIDIQGNIITNTIAGVFAMPITGFAAGDAITFALDRGIVPGTPTFSTSWDQQHNLLTVTGTLDGSSATLATFDLVGTYPASGFHVSGAPLTLHGVSMEQVTLTTTHA